MLQYQAYYKSRLELGSLPKCFDRCVTDVLTGSGLNSDEKNCMRECYLKKLGSRDDVGMYLSQMMARENLKEAKDTFV